MTLTFVDAVRLIGAAPVGLAAIAVDISVHMPAVSS
jgi:hypothetical protein